jgi:hypothetical protein
MALYDISDGRFAPAEQATGTATCLGRKRLVVSRSVGVLLGEGGRCVPNS